MADLRDLGIGKLRKQLAAMGGKRITVGWQGASGAQEHIDGDVTVADVGLFMEFGTVNAPARPAVRTTLDRHEKAARDEIRRGLSDVIDGRATPEQVEERVGDLLVAKLRETIDDAKQWAEPLAPSTAAAKGHDRPLVDTGHLRSQASWAVRKGDRIERQGGEG